MGSTWLELSQQVHRILWRHLLPARSHAEQAAFLFTRRITRQGEIVFEVVDWLAVKPDGFVYQAEGYLELTDATRGAVIKRAHDLDASIVEFHSHPYPWPARFSPSDREGLEEFVPHVWWRLKGKPYLAAVVAPLGFDALIWLTNPRTPSALTGIRIGRRMLRPTGLSLREW